jgi:phosphoribosylamine---glycine ligase
MGDPETQAVMPRIKSDFVEILAATAKGELKGKKIEIDDNYSVTVALVSGGYPGDYEKGKKIKGLDKEKFSALVFHAGTKGGSEDIVTDGGRVLAVTGKGNSLEQARQAAYTCAGAIQWEGLYYRKDIGMDLLKYKGV